MQNQFLNNFDFPKPGENWGNFFIEKELGRGGMGVVYKAIQKEPHREVAIKITKKSLKEIDSKRFQREIEISAQFDHPNIVKIHGIEKYQQFVLLIMEYIPAMPLMDYFKKHDLPDKEKIKIFINICRGLKYAHQKNIVHRDLKPANILITEQGVPKIIDFGLAKQLEREFDLTKTGEIIGTPCYMAPEQISGTRQDIDVQTDIYALGAIFYEAMTLKRMVSGESVMEIFYNIQYEKYTPPSGINQNLKDNFDKIWGKAIARDKNERYKNVTEMIRDFQKVIRGKKVRKPYNRKFTFKHSLFMVVVAILIILTINIFLAKKTVKLNSEEQTVIAYVQDEQYENAIDFYEDPKNSLTNNGLLQRQINKAYYEMRKKALVEKDKKEKKRLIKRIKDFFVNDLELHYHLAEVYLPDNFRSPVKEFGLYDADELSIAKLNLEKCISINPYNPDFFFLLGKIAFIENNYQKAYEYFKTSYQLNPENMDCIELLSQIPYYDPRFAGKCYRFVAISLEESGTVFAPNLYEDQILQFDEEDIQGNFAYVSARLVPQEKMAQIEKNFNEWLEKLHTYSLSGEHIAEIMFSFRYCQNFEQKLVHLQEKSPEDKELKSFIDKLLNKKTKEFEHHFKYVITDIYKNKNWKLKLRGLAKEEDFKEKIVEVLSSSKDLFLIFKCVDVFIERYNFVDLLDLASNTEIPLANRIIITSRLLVHHIPVTKSAFFEIENSGLRNDFLDYLIADSLFVTHELAPRDNVGREAVKLLNIRDRFWVIIFSQEERKLWNYLLKQNHPYTQISIQTSLYCLLDSRYKTLQSKLEKDLVNRYGRQQTNIILEDMENDIGHIKSARVFLQERMGLSEKAIVNYIHYYYWRARNTIWQWITTDKGDEYAKVFLHYLESLPDDKIRKYILSNYADINTFHTYTKDGILKILESSKKSEFLLLKTVAESQIENLDFPTFEELVNKPFYSASQKGYLISTFLYFSVRNYKRNRSTLNKVYGDLQYYNNIITQKNSNKFFQCFAIHFLSLFNYPVLKYFPPQQFHEDPKLLANILFSQYSYEYSDEMKITFGSLSNSEKQEIIKEYLREQNEHIQKIASTIHTSLIGTISEELSSEEYDGLFLKLRHEVILKQNRSAMHILNAEYEEIYMNYILYLKEHYPELQEKYPALIYHLTNYDISFSKNPEHALENIILRRLSGEANETIIKYLDNAIEKPEYKYFRHWFLFEKADILEEMQNPNENIVACLDQVSNSVSSFFWLPILGEKYFSLDSHANHDVVKMVYTRIFTSFDSGQNTYKYTELCLALVGIYAKEGNHELARKIYESLNEVQKRRENNRFTNYPAKGLIRRKIEFYMKQFPVLKNFENELMEIMHE